MWEVPIPNADLTAWDYINAKTAILLGFKDLFITKKHLHYFEEQEGFTNQIKE